MRKIILPLMFCLLVFSGCSKDDENTKTITNLSGIAWYKTTVVFFDVEGGDITDYKDVGTVEIGKSCNVASSKTIFHILAKDATGNGIMSNDLHFTNNKATVTANDLR